MLGNFRNVKPENDVTDITLFQLQRPHTPQIRLMRYLIFKTAFRRKPNLPQPSGVDACLTLSPPKRSRIFQRISAFFSSRMLSSPP